VSKPFNVAWFEVLEEGRTLLYLIREQLISRQVSFVEFSTNLPEGPSRSG